ncbi:amylo-alpha-1,6-glucosidase [Anaeromicropila herbilytica]|uniref:Glycogen debranching protein n=1 Tax=Anaeromicropila herbilytica TaxID=2785025 RepID=A0A7R7ENK0_9FIRM|nr:amylo-alpha-1,6-glucosidase [Anaeromicropila herbilytica]BCN32139.1 hypothetical protein bsdtb5_34340 [Anaeromicropila herbilytica]
MGISYKLGRSNYRNFHEGLEKEWLLTNGIGGFACLSIIGARNRIYSSYLIASLRPPMDRKLILANIYESITIGDKEYDFATQEYNGNIREGQKYLTRFELDIVPTYCYEVEDVKIKKTISMEYGTNSVVVCYEIQNGSSKAKMNLTPLFNYRNPGEASERSTLLFKTIVHKKELKLYPIADSNYEIVFYTSEGEYYDRGQKPVSMATPNYIIDENQVCYIDRRNGFLGVDNQYTPYDVIIDLEAFETKRFYVKCELKECNHKEDDYEMSQGLGSHIRIQVQKEENEYIYNCKDGFEVIKEYKKRLLDYIERIPDSDSFIKMLTIAADQYIVERESTGLKTILAGYPWFSDWGRDTMIAMQGLTLATRRYEDARGILESFSRYIKEGMVPNVFPQDAKEDPMYNTIDASLWYFIAVYQYLQATGGKEDYEFIRVKIYPYLKEIIEAYQNGTKYEIGMDKDCLIKGGSNLDQLTWMDVRVGEIVVTPRHGKAVEINALWYNALQIMNDLTVYYGENNTRYLEIAKKVKQSFVEKFWNEQSGCLYDVIEEKMIEKQQISKEITSQGNKNRETTNCDANKENRHQEYTNRENMDKENIYKENIDKEIIDREDINRKNIGYVNQDITDKEYINKKNITTNNISEGNIEIVEIKDNKIRPNQIYAVSLPFSILDKEKEMSVVEVVHKHLYTPYGIRSLALLEEGYKGEYIGKLINRDMAYHMGTAWGFLMGGFIEAYLKVHNHNEKAVLRAKEMCEYFEDHMQDGCINQIAEIFDGNSPTTGRGCFAQAWSVGEILRVYTNDIYPYLPKDK